MAGLIGVFACTNDRPEEVADQEPKEFIWKTEQFADLKIIRYQIPSWDQLSAEQRVLVYYLTQAGLAGRDIIWDQNYRHNLSIRRTLEKIVREFDGDRASDDWENFMVYTKRVWFSNGIHHHYSMSKIMPDFSQEYFKGLLELTGQSLTDEVMMAIFDPAYDAKKVNLDPDKGLVTASAVNFYEPGITEDEVNAYYAGLKEGSENKRLSFGINSKVVRNSDGNLEEKVWKVGGMYTEALEQVVYWLEQAITVAENDKQAAALKLLVKYYRSGSLEDWDKFNVAWVNATEGDIDYIQGFVEVYNDPKGYKGSYESVVEINDFDASERMAVVASSAQWFEDNSPIMDAHKKDSVVGITYKVVSVGGEAGDASPSTPIGVNLPNANWIRVRHGSKSVSLGNIVYAYEQARGKGFLEEFAHDEEEVERAKKYGSLASKLHTALHEVIGHASGQIEDGVGTPKETLKSYASTLEEGRADLVALYYVMDPKLVEMGLIESLEVGMAEYDGYLRNGLMTQLQRIEPGEVIEESHMRNRQFVSRWVFERGQENNVVEMVERDGKTYININDYEGLRELFGELLREVQRIKSQGDYEAGRALVEDYGVTFDTDLHAQVLSRVKELNLAPYGGFINPRIMPVMEGDQIIDAEVEYPDDFTEQMLEYADKYSFLPNFN
jgi:dipeptidyl-peptidase-3